MDRLRRPTRCQGLGRKDPFNVAPFTFRETAKLRTGQSAVLNNSRVLVFLAGAVARDHARLGLTTGASVAVV